MKQIPLAIAAHSAPSFDNFLPGVNTPVIAHLQALVAAAPPVYLWGVSGSGKSHLMQALAHQLAEQGMRTGWFSASVPLPWCFDDTWALIAIDDCDALDANQQHTAFTLFVDAACC